MSDPTDPGRPAPSRAATRAVAATDEIRSHFPALKRRHGDRPVAYFDGPGGTQVPRAVGDAVADYLYHHNANTRWKYPSSEETDEALAHARRVFGTFFNASPHEIVFGANMTTLTYHLARALGRRWGPGDEVVVTELDHHANIGPWTALEVERGVKVKWARMLPETGQLDWDHLSGLLGPRTKLLAIGAAANALGTENDVFRATDMAQHVGALTFVDGVHYAPHILPDVGAVGCDFFACSAYKCYGPHVGILFVRSQLLESLDFPKLVPAPNEAPARAETGTLNHEGIVGSAAAIEWLGSLTAGNSLRNRLTRVYEELHHRSHELLRLLWDGLSAVPGVRLYGPEPDAARTPTAAFVVSNWPSSRVARHLGERGVFVSHGDFYAHTVVERLGLQPEGLVRAGCACYTTAAEIDRLVEGVSALGRETASLR